MTDRDAERAVARGIQRQKDAEKSANSCAGFCCLGVFALMIAAIVVFKLPDSGALGIACIVVPLIAAGVIHHYIHKSTMNA
jgi:hypothetical protein